ncbi:hypothetical protein M422DRAFT_25492, partial [Sphaerobolus stellatus SS14]
PLALLSALVFGLLFIPKESLANAPSEGPLKFSIPLKLKEYLPYQRLARCSAINRSETGDSATVQLQYVHIVNPNATRTLLLVHGWPSIWSTWSNQIAHFASSYSLIVPTLRGFGSSTHPGDVQNSGAVQDHTEDLACILREAGVSSATCVGHDWGAQVCWESARARPDLIEAVSGIVVPYLPSAGPFLPIEVIVKLLPHLSYQVRKIYWDFLIVT